MREDKLDHKTCKGACRQTKMKGIGCCTDTKYKEVNVRLTRYCAQATSSLELTAFGNYY